MATVGLPEEGAAARDVEQQQQQQQHEHKDPFMTTQTFRLQGHFKAESHNVLVCVQLKQQFLTLHPLLKKKTIQPICVCSLFIIGILVATLMIQFPSSTAYDVVTGSQKMFFVEGAFLTGVVFAAAQGPGLQPLPQLLVWAPDNSDTCAAKPELTPRTWTQVVDVNPGKGYITTHFDVPQASAVNISVAYTGSCPLELWVLSGDCTVLPLPSSFLFIIACCRSIRQPCHVR